MWNKLKLRFKILIPVSILLLVATISVSYLVSTLSKVALIDVSLANMETTAKQAAASIDNRLRIHEEELRGVGRVNEIRSLKWDTIPALLTQISKDYQYLALAVVDSARIAHYQDGSTTNLSNREYIEKAFQGEANTSDVIVSRVTNSTVIMVAAPIYDVENPQKVNAVLIGRLPAIWLSELTDDIQFIEGSYAYIINSKGEMIAHRNRDFVLEQRNFIEDAKTDSTFRTLASCMQKMVAGGSGYNKYMFQGGSRLTAYASIERKAWSIAIVSEEAVLNARIGEATTSVGIATVIIVLLGFALIIFISRLVTNPIRRATQMLEDIAQGEGDLTQRMVIANEDEIGELAHWFNVFIEKIQVIIRDITQNTNTLSSSSEELSSVANQIAANAEEMTAQSTTVASATEQSSVNLNGISSASEQVSAAVSTMASAIEELNASMREVENRCNEEVQAVQQATSEATTTRDVMQKLEGAADNIGKVVEIINKIAAQTNLLALNATIEAAAAGEAGKGFAVVASEVKDLARQTATATQEIAVQVQEIQGNTSVAAEATERFTKVIDEISQISQAILVSVREQNSTVNDLARNVNGINDGTQDTARNVAESAQGLAEVSENIAGVSQAVSETAQGVDQVRVSAQNLTQLAADLEAIVRQFRV